VSPNFIKGTYDQIHNGDSLTVAFVGLTDPSRADVFSLTSNGYLMIKSNGQIAFADTSQ